MPPRSTSKIPKAPLANFGAGLSTSKPEANPFPVQHGPVSQGERAFSAASTFFSGCMAISATQFIGAPLKLVDPKFYEAYIAFTKQSFAVLITTMTQWWSPTVVRVSGDRSIPGQLFQRPDGSLQCKFPNRLVLMANHQLYTDWLYLWWAAYTNNMSGYIYIILKESIKNIPIFGWAAQFYNFIFLSRKWETDKSRFEEALEKLNNPKDPMWLMIFPEGTNLSPTTRDKSKAFAQKMGYEDMKHQLLPRSTGLRFCLQKLGKTTPWLYDCTIAYEGIPKGQYGQDVFTLRSSMFEGRPPKSVNMHFRRFAVSSIPVDNEAAFDVWLRNRWREKDYLLEHFSRYNRFPEDHKWMLNGQGNGRAKRLGPKPAKLIETQIKSGNFEEFLSIFAPLTAFMTTMYLFYGGANPNDMLKTIGQGKQMEMLTGGKMPKELLEMMQQNGPMIEKQLQVLMPQMAAQAPMLTAPAGTNTATNPNAKKNSIQHAYNELNQKVSSAANQAKSPYALKGLAGNPRARPQPLRRGSIESVSTTSTTRPAKLASRASSIAPSSSLSNRPPQSVVSTAPSASTMGTTTLASSRRPPVAAGPKAPTAKAPIGMNGTTKTGPPAKASGSVKKPTANGVGPQKPSAKSAQNTAGTGAARPINISPEMLEKIKAQTKATASTPKNVQIDQAMLQKLREEYSKKKTMNSVKRTPVQT